MRRSLLTEGGLRAGRQNVSSSYATTTTTCCDTITVPNLASRKMPARPPVKLLFPSLERLYAAAGPVSSSLLRAAFGIIMMTHGIPKLLAISHGSMAGSIRLIENVLHST